MATGDQQDFVARIKALLPRWFGDNPPLLTGILNGLAWAGSLIYSQIIYAKLQTRIKTATDGWLDMIAVDLFGVTLLRSANQGDASFRARILINLIRERATRNAIIKILQDITGRTPIVFEPMRPADTGAYGAPNSGYGLAGGYGSVLLPFQAFVTAYRPATAGIPSVAGYGVPTGAYSTPSQGELASISMVQSAVSDADIYAAIDSVKPAATSIWTRLTS